MTRKDYQLIAGVLQQNRAQFGQYDERAITLDAVAHQFATALEDTNPRFDRARFLTACGVN